MEQVTTEGVGQRSGALQPVYLGEPFPAAFSASVFWPEPAQFRHDLLAQLGTSPVEGVIFVPEPRDGREDGLSKAAAMKGGRPRRWP